MRRLQANLTYLAALADRKTHVSAPACPAYLTPPLLTLSIKMRAAAPAPGEAAESSDPTADRLERDKVIKELYRRLQTLFPGIDPKKEPASQMGGPRPAGQPPGPGGGKGSNGQMSAGPSSAHGSPAPGPSMNKTPQMANAAPPFMQGQPIGF